MFRTKCINMSRRVTKKNGKKNCYTFFIGYPGYSASGGGENHNEPFWRIDITKLYRTKLAIDCVSG